MASALGLAARRIAISPFFSSISPIILRRRLGAGHIRNIYSTTTPGHNQKNHVKLDKIIRAEFEVAEELNSFETVGATDNEMAGEFANGAVIMTMGDAKVLATVNAASCVMNNVDDHHDGRSARKGILNVDYEESLYTSRNNADSLMMRRDGAGIINRAIRQLFPAGFLQDIQIMARLLSQGRSVYRDPVVMAANAASAALMLSDIPWGGPIGVVHIGWCRGHHVYGGTVSRDAHIYEDAVVNPTSMNADIDFNLIYACTKDKTLTIDVRAKYPIPEDDLKVALRMAHREALNYIQPQIRLAAKAGRRKNNKAVDYKLSMVTDRTLNKIKSLAEGPMKAVFSSGDSTWSKRNEELNTIKQDVKRVLKQECNDQESLKVAGKAVDTVMKDVLRRRIIEERIRVDGRGLNEVRPVHCDRIFEKHHGSSTFSLGDTTVECIVAFDDRHMHFRQNLQVNSSTGCNRNYFAENALMCALKLGIFYQQTAVIVKSKLLDNNNKYNCDYAHNNSSTSCMATICGASLALRDYRNLRLVRNNVAGIAGVSMGLVSEVDPSTGMIQDYRILTDICGLEECEGLGDMDLRIAGTWDGVTAIQLTILSKNGVPLDIILECLEPALQARRQILLHMNTENASQKNSNSSSNSNPNDSN